MASPLPTAKQSVNLASPGVAGSRIRRAPPPPVKELKIVDPRERDRNAVIFGIVASALAVVAILVGLGSYTGWSPRDYTAHL